MILNFFHFWITFFCVIISVSLISAISVQTKLGKIIGTKKVFENVPIYEFLGIPYGKAPTAEQRFHPSKLVEKLPQIPYYANKPTAHCPMSNFSSLSNAPISEDCLHLNIWMPITNQENEDENKLQKLKCNEKKFSVIVYIYGGIGSIFMQKSLADNQLMYDGSSYAAFGGTIFITVNYRSGPFSNLYIPGIAPGNAGLFDQALALQWIQKHISSFCGNASSVTIFGNSYGSFAISLQLISPISSPYFSSAIMQSGSSLFSMFMPDTPKEAYEKSLHFADLVGCLVKTPFNKKKVVDGRCLQQIPLEKTLKHLGGFRHFYILGGEFFTPEIIKNYYIHGKLLISQDKRLMIGVVDNEFCLGTALTGTFSNDSHPPSTKKQAEDMVTRLSESIFQFGPKSKHFDISGFLGKFYASNERDFNQKLSSTFDGLLSDVFFNCPSVLYAKHATEALLPGNVHTFVINKTPSHHLANAFDQMHSEFDSVCHADEIIYNFGMAFRAPSLFTQEDRDFSIQLIHIMTNFVQDHKLPNVINGKGVLQPWPYSTKKNLNFINIQLDELISEPQDFEIRCESVFGLLRPFLLKMEGPNESSKNRNYYIIGGVILSICLIIFLLWRLILICKKRSQYQTLEGLSSEKSEEQN